MEAERQRLAEHARHLMEVGLHQVATWAADAQTWMISQASAGASVDYLDGAEEHAASPKEDARQVSAAFFMKGPGKIALFETVRDTQRRAIAVKVVAFRTLPVFITQAMTTDTASACCD